MDEQHSSRLLHRLDKHTGFRGHGRVGQLEGVEVHDSIQNAVGCGRSGTDEDGQAIQGTIYDKSIAMARDDWSVGVARATQFKVQTLPAIILKYAQHSVQETRCLGLELSRIEKGMVGGDHAQRHLQAVALITMVSCCTMRFLLYSPHLVIVVGCRLCQDHALREFDATQPHGRGSTVPDPENPLLDGHQLVPGTSLVGVMYAKKKER